MACDLQCICCIPHPQFRLAEVALRRAQFERPPLLEALKERKEMMKSEPRYDMNQGGLLCGEPWFDLRHLSFVTSYVAWATLSATLHGLCCMGYVAWATLSATLHGLRCDMLRDMGYVAWATLAATLHGLRYMGYVWQLHFLILVVFATWIRKNPSQSFREKESRDLQGSSWLLALPGSS